MEVLNVILYALLKIKFMILSCTFLYRNEERNSQRRTRNEEKDQWNNFKIKSWKRSKSKTGDWKRRMRIKDFAQYELQKKTDQHLWQHFYIVKKKEKV